MEKAVEKLFTQEVLEQSFHKFSLNHEYKKIGDFENYVFEVHRDDKPFILRITHSSHRREEELHSEIDWINYLHHAGVNVCNAVASIEGLFVESIPANDGSVFYSCLLTKVPGNPVRVENDEFDDNLFFSWGKTIGEMHRVTKDYQPSRGIKRRSDWYEDDLLSIENYVPNQEKTIITNTKALINELQALPKNTDNYGLIHSDLHSSNFFYDGDAIHVFDFDDCCYFWYCSDIAIPLYYANLYRYPQGNKNIRNEFSKRFIKAFMNGYETENAAPHKWEEQIQFFLRLRDATLYSVLHKKVPQERRTGKLEALLIELRERLEKNEAIVDIDFFK
ncbi:Ser/Thr protein kinase RdoA involved in Cpx stress response, MazF antagonist [Oceanobacillus limi]|uniref:Ser/Thr protein kinase RdoA involved in Cpx stress response, MazF antagonist n=1 Tax=Oceanobacillus limi TaxID=930131 RepID=A0A1I0CF10_9BACI|nr:phosphotransferase [Oceanobacillus limi]SET18160.1 Ser/Thr protein kinase RdoA involved in Cpx stress response, MazF antagonist [Oceanobacillus limi]